MRIKKFNKKMRQASLYPYKTFEDCPQEKRSDFLYYLYRKCMRGEVDINEAILWLEAIGELPADYH